MKITRREFVSRAGIAAAAGILPVRGALALGTHPPAQPRRPNIVLVVSDDMDCSYLGCYGGAALTPNLDVLASQGARFAESYCVSSICAPSRYSILTGQYPGRCTHPGFSRANPQGELACIGFNTDMSVATPTIARMLGAAGYRTGFVGKWGVGFDDGMADTLPSLSAGDDPDDPAVDARLRDHQAALTALIRKTGGFDYAASAFAGNIGNNYPRKLQHHTIEWITQGALDFIDEATACNRPFFVYIAPTTVHGPGHDADLDADSRYTMGGKRARPFACHPPRATIRERLGRAGLPVDSDHVGMTFYDDMIGAVMAKLRDAGLENDTIVITVADNGVEPGKYTCHQRGVRLPMMMKWPAQIDPGTVVTERVQHIDLVPTLLEAASAAAPADARIDGTSFLGAVTGCSSLERDALYFEVGMTRGVLRGNLKYIALRYKPALINAMESGSLDMAPDTAGATNQMHNDIAIRYYPSYFDPDQLYDLPADPNEQRNLAGDPAHAAALAEMKELLAKFTGAMPHPYPCDAPPFMASANYRQLVAKRVASSRGRKWWNEGFSW